MNQQTFNRPGGRILSHQVDEFCLNESEGTALSILRAHSIQRDGKRKARRG